MTHRLISLLITLVIISGFVPALYAQEEAVSLQFWITDTEPERAEKTEELFATFTQITGIDVNMVLIDENTLSNVIRANFAAGTLPDVIFHPVVFSVAWYEEGILSSEAANEVVNNLGADFFSGLSFVDNADGDFVAVPVDGWGQLVIYRADLFENAGLEPPTSFEAIATAAAALHDPENNFYGIVAATDPTSVFTQQTFEHFALANGVQLTNNDGDITLNTPEMAQTIDFYADLVTAYGPPGVQTVASTREIYLAGQATMTIWSPYILDELAGLHDNIRPTCAECSANPAFLAENSAIITAITGPHSETPRQYGQISAMGITTSAHPEAVTLVEYLLSEGYPNWLAIAPEGRVPMRWGTADDPDQFIEHWRNLETDPQNADMLAELYGGDFAEQLIESATNFSRWGFEINQDKLAGALYETLIVPEYLNRVINGELSGAEAAAEIQAAVETLQQSLDQTFTLP